MISGNKLKLYLEEIRRRLADMETSLSVMAELNRGLDDRLKALEVKRNGNRQRQTTGSD